MRKWLPRRAVFWAYGIWQVGVSTAQNVALEREPGAVAGAAFLHNVIMAAQHHNATLCKKALGGLANGAMISNQSTNVDRRLRFLAQVAGACGGVRLFVGTGKSSLGFC